MLQKQATYRRTPPDLKFTIERAAEEGGGESEYSDLSAFLTYRA